MSTKTLREWMKKIVSVLGEGWLIKTAVAVIIATVVYLRWRGIVSFLAGVVLAIPVGSWGSALVTHTGIPEQPPMVLMYLLGGMSVSWLTFLLLPPKTGFGSLLKKD